MKRTIALIMALLLSAGCFACADDSGKDAETTANPNAATTVAETDPEDTGLPEPDLGDLKFDGETFKMMSLSDHAYTIKQMYSDGEDGEVVNDNVFRRNELVKEKFGIEIEGIDDKTPINTIRKAHNGGELVAHVFWDQMIVVMPQAPTGYLLDFNTVPHVNFESGYWDANMAKDLEVSGKLFMMNSDIYMAAAMARFIFFNKTVLELYKLKSPYEYVDENKWTLDVFGQMCKAVNEDLDGDGNYDGDDRFGLLEEYPMHFLAGAGVLITENDEDGIPQVTCMNERTVAVLEKIASFTQDPTCALNYTDVAKGKDTSGFMHIYMYGRSRFAADQFLFVQNGADTTKEFKDMQSDYGIVPNPKYDEQQEEYYHLMDPHSMGMAIPSLNVGDDLNMTGAILEYMSWVSSSTVIPAYYETTILNKRTRDEIAPLMLDIVRKSTRYEITSMCGITLDDIFMSAEEKNNLMSQWESKSKNIIKRLEKYAEKFAEME